MTFEHQMRDRLQATAAEVTLRGRGVDHVIGRARARRRHRQAALGSLAGAALLAGSVGYVARRHSDPSGEVAVGTAHGLPASGPLELDWAIAEGGVTQGMAVSVAPDGTIYALSTAPGARSADMTKADTLYSMGADGDWSSGVVGAASDLADVAAGAELLYGIGTAPTTRGLGYVPMAATSSDGGRSWRRSELPSVAAPSSVVVWLPSSSVQVAALGDSAVAVVTTGFSVRAADLPGVDLADDDSYGLVAGDEGLSVIRPTTGADGRPGATDRTTPVEATEAQRGETGEVDIVPWPDLGVEGAGDLRRTDVYVVRGDGWVPAAEAIGPLRYVSSMTVIGDEFVLSGSRPLATDPSMSEMVALASSDGQRWREVSVPSDGGSVVGVGSTWVTIGPDGRSLQVSGDGGTTWRPVGLPRGLPGNGYLYGLTGGPLGLALWLQAESGPGTVIVSRDLESWATLDLAGLGVEPDLGPPAIIVGTDRVVVTVAVSGDEEPGRPSRSRTIVGTPVRTTETSPSTTVTTAVSATSAAPATSTTTEPVATTTTTAVAPVTSTTTSVAATSAP